MLTCFQGPDHKFGMGIVPGGDKNSIDLIVIENSLAVRGDLRKPMLAPDRMGAHPGCRTKHDRGVAANFLERRQDDRLCEIPGTNQAKRYVRREE